MFQEVYANLSFVSLQYLSQQASAADSLCLTLSAPNSTDDNCTRTTYSAAYGVYIPCRHSACIGFSIVPRTISRTGRARICYSTPYSTLSVTHITLERTARERHRLDRTLLRVAVVADRRRSCGQKAAAARAIRAAAQPKAAAGCAVPRTERCSACPCHSPRSPAVAAGPSSRA